MTDQRTSKFKDVLNALVEMQHSPAYAVRREVLSRAELLIADLEHANIALSAALADAERRVWEEAAKGREAHVVYGPSDEAYDNEVGKDGDGTSYNQGIRAAIAWIRAQATQEEG